MALPSLVRKLFENDGYGPHLKPAIIPFATSLASDGAEAATTEWVKDLAVAPVYVDPNGSNSNDGLSSATAVQTIGKAIEISNSMHLGQAVIYAAAGTYAGNVFVSAGITAIVYFSGNTTINGAVAVGTGSHLSFYGDNVDPTVTINATATDLSYAAALLISAGSSFNSGVAIYVSGGTSNYQYAAVIAASSGGSIYTSKNITISGNSNYGFYLRENSVLRCEADIIFDNSITVGYAIRLLDSATFMSYGNITYNGTITTCALYVERASSFQCDGIFSAKTTNSSSYYVVAIRHASAVAISSFILNYDKNTTSSIGISVESNAIAVFDNLEISSSKNTSHFIQAISGGVIFVTSSYKLSGVSNYACTYALDNGYFDLASSATVTNSATGARYLADYNSVIQVHGAGASRLPGSSNGAANNYSSYR